jgi:hypothetical protein
MTTATAGVDGGPPETDIAAAELRLSGEDLAAPG